MGNEDSSWVIDDKADQERIDGFRLMDDDFFSEVFEGNKDAVKRLLSIVLDKNDIKIVDVKTQVEYRNAIKRSIRLDVRAVDSKGNVYDIEVQRDEEELTPERGRYHSSVVDRPLLEKGQKFAEIPDSYVIFITEKDKYGKGKPMYHIRRTVKELDDAEYGDRNTIIYVNGEFRDEEHPVGKLMHDFQCTEAKDMFYPELAETVRFYKETEGGRKKMCKVMEDMRNETAVRATISAYYDVDIRDEDTLVKKVMEKFAFLSQEVATKYVQDFLGMHIA